MTILQFIGCLLFNVRHLAFIHNNKDNITLVIARFLYILIMTYTLIIATKFFICFVIVKVVFDIISSIIKLEASGVITSKYKELLIDDVVNIISFVIYVGG
jgi:hypothetical protein